MANRYMHDQLVAILGEIARCGIDDKHVGEVAETMGLDLTPREQGELYRDLMLLSEAYLTLEQLDLVAQSVEFRWLTDDGRAIAIAQAA